MRVYRADRHVQPHVVVPAIEVALLLVIWAGSPRGIANRAATLEAREALRVHFGASGSDVSANERVCKICENGIMI